MAFNIAEFESNVRASGTLPNNKYYVELFPPAGGGDLVMFRAEHAFIPSISLETIFSNRYGFGPIQLFPTNVRFERTTLTLLETASSDVMNIFYSWLDSIVNTSGNAPSFLVNYKETFVRDMKIYVFDQMGNNVQNILLTEAFPIGIGEVPLSWSDNNTAMRINISLAFTRWYPQKLVSAPPSPGSSVTTGINTPSQVVTPPQPYYT